MERKLRIFPEGFLWGVATAAHQVEGGNTNNDWYEWECRGNTRHHSRNACNHWDLTQFKSDLEIARLLGINTYRLSIEWSRIFPKQGFFDEAAVQRYRAMLKLIKEADMQTIVTLHHFTNPIWFTQQGGWESGPLYAFETYVRFIARFLNDLVDFWIPFNEPFSLLFMGWIFGKFPPGKERNYIGFLRTLGNIIKTHNTVYGILKKESGKPVGMVNHCIAFEPVSKNWVDVQATRFGDWLLNKYIFSVTKNDFLGVNYYYRLRLKTHVWNFDISQAEPELPQTDNGWEIYPEGFYKVLMSFAKIGLPIYIMENGVADGSDLIRQQYIIDHLSAMHRAISDGADIRGYIHWTLLDNFEWADGYDPKFGLIAFNPETGKRTLRPSAHLYANIIHHNALPP
ncbi:MAG: family 1 glycosylhydrolase [bacterium]|nr:family 1 glycosylhydrolase [bacterium]